MEWTDRVSLTALSAALHSAQLHLQDTQQLTCKIIIREDAGEKIPRAWKVAVSTNLQLVVCFSSFAWLFILNFFS